MRTSSGTLRDALDTAFIKPENVVAAFVYDEGNGSWRSVVVFRKGKHNIQRGISCDSVDEACSCLGSQIANVKATCEHPAVGDFRRRVIEPNGLVWLGVHHKQFGYRYVERYIDGIQAEALEFLKKQGLAEDMPETLQQEALLYAARLARDTVLLYAPEFATDDPVLRPPAGTDKSADEIALWQEAASYLLVGEAADIDDEIETDIIYERALRFPDKSSNMMWITGAVNARTISNDAGIPGHLAMIASAAAADVRSKSKRGVESDASALPVSNKQKMSAEHSWPDNEVIVPKTREEYVKDFRHCFRNWDAADNSLARSDRTPSESRIRSTIEMCRVVYEAQRSLGHREFENFCKEIDLTKQSAIRKFIAFGQAYPGVMQYMKSVEARQWFIIDLYLRIPSGFFPSSEGFAEMWKNMVTYRRLDADASNQREHQTMTNHEPDYELLPRAELGGRKNTQRSYCEQSRRCKSRLNPFRCGEP
jgi:hypothetical protein